MVKQHVAAPPAFGVADGSNQKAARGTTSAAPGRPPKSPRGPRSPSPDDGPAAPSEPDPARRAFSVRRARELQSSSRHTARRPRRFDRRGAAPRISPTAEISSGGWNRQPKFHRALRRSRHCRSGTARAMTLCRKSLNSLAWPTRRSVDVLLVELRAGVGKSQAQNSSRSSLWCRVQCRSELLAILVTLALLAALSEVVPNGAQSPWWTLPVGNKGAL